MVKAPAEIGLRVHATFFGLPAPSGVPMLPPAEDDPEMPEIQTARKTLEHTSSAD